MIKSIFDAWLHIFYQDLWLPWLGLADPSAADRRCQELLRDVLILQHRHNLGPRGPRGPPGGNGAGPSYGMRPLGKWWSFSRRNESFKHEESRQKRLKRSSRCQHKEGVSDTVV